MWATLPAFITGYKNLSLAVKSGFNFHAMVSASKGAIEGLSVSLAAELAPKIRVNCIAPSLTDTPLAESLLNNEAKREANAQRNPLKRIGNANDIAEMAGFLISGKSGWITVQVFHVDGGISTLKIRHNYGKFAIFVINKPKVFKL